MMIGKLKTSFLWAALLLFAFSYEAGAHPPKDVSISFNPNGNLTVKVDHSVNDPQKHYINKIIVYINNNIAIQKDYSSQTDGEGLTDTFSIGPQAPGTNIKVEAYCVIMGSAEKSITLP
jgi:desulfoferrodoxin (superoxide reductase-like protein)